MQTVPLLDTQLRRKLICDLSNDVIDIPLDITFDSLDRSICAGDNAAEERADRGSCWCGARCGSRRSCIRDEVVSEG